MKKYETATNVNMSKRDCSKTNPIIAAHEDNVHNESELRILIEQNVDN